MSCLSEDLSACAPEPPAKARPRCRGCKRGAASRPRGLCRSCYGDLESRGKCKSVKPRGNRCPVPDLGPGISPTPPAPTFTTPGTAERIAVIFARLLAGYSVMHPEDRRRDMTDEDAERAAGEWQETARFAAEQATLRKGVRRAG